jgi:hypothetical protein
MNDRAYDDDEEDKIENDAENNLQLLNPHLSLSKKQVARFPCA